nr:uncharacterized protein LOC107454790 isoform X2 [Parasteatoda tepidariorum]
MDISSSFTASVSSTSSCKPKLTIEGELKDSLRFRYKSEKGCHGGLKPVIKLHGYKSYNDIWIKATLYTSGINPTLHCLELEGKDCKDGVGWKQLSKDFTARFDSLAICIKKRDELVDLLKEKVAQNLKKKKLQYDVKDLVKEVRERMKTLNLNSGILCFEAFYCKDERQPVCQKILSQPIYNQKAGVSEDLRIRQLSKCSGLTKGNEDIILLCDKVHKDDVEVIFSCLCVDWSARAHLNPADFHYQFAIPIKTPRFPKNYEQEVSIKLCRKSDGKTGVPMKFRYMPCDDYDADLPLKQKQPNPSDCISMPMSAIKREPSSTPDVHNPNFQDLNGLIKFLKTYNNSEFDAPEIEETEYRLPLVTPESFLRQAEPAAQKEYANQEWRNTSCPEIKSVQILRSHIINFLGEGKAFLKYLPALLSMKDENGNSLLHVVVAEKSENLHLLVKIIKAAPIGLINQTNDAKMTPLHVAVSKGLWKVVRILLMAGANPDIKDTNGNTCTHLAAMHNFPWCLSEILLPLLVKDKKRKHLPNVNLLNNEGFSPLQLAVKKESQICVKLLIQAKANLNIFDEKSCSTPLLLSNLLRFQNPVLPQPSVSNTIGGAKIIQGFVPTIPFTPSQATILPNKAVGEVTPSNLLAKGELFLDCEEETLSAAQLSANDTDWNAFTKEVENVTISSVLNTSQAQEPSSNQTITIISPEKLGPPKTILPKPLNFQSGGPVTIPASSLNQHLIKFNPFPNSPAPSNKTYALKIPEIEKGSLSQSTSNSGPRFIKIVPPQSAAQTATTSKFTGAPQILRLRTENSTGNIQIVNPPTGVMPQIIKIGNQTLQLISATVGQQKVVTVNETAKIPVGVPASGFATVANNQPVVESSSLLGGDVLMNFNDNDVPSLPSFLQTNTSNETAIPMRLEKADESADRMTPKGEVILPLLPKDKAGETESILSDSVLLSASSPSPSGNEEEEIVVDVDLSNVTTVYDDESIPNSASSEQNTVINIPVQCNNADSINSTGLCTDFRPAIKFDSVDELRSLKPSTVVTLDRATFAELLSDFKEIDSFPKFAEQNAEISEIHLTSFDGTIAAVKTVESTKQTESNLICDALNSNLMKKDGFTDFGIYLQPFLVIPETSENTSLDYDNNSDTSTSALSLTYTQSPIITDKNFNHLSRGFEISLGLEQAALSSPVIVFPSQSADIPEILTSSLFTDIPEILTSSQSLIIPEIFTSSQSFITPDIIFNQSSQGFETSVELEQVISTSPETLTSPQSAVTTDINFDQSSQEFETSVELEQVASTSAETLTSPQSAVTTDVNFDQLLQGFEASYDSQSEKLAHCQSPVSQPAAWCSEDAGVETSQNVNFLKCVNDDVRKGKKEDPCDRGAIKFRCRLCLKDGFYSAYNVKRHCKNVHKIDVIKSCLFEPYIPGHQGESSSFETALPSMLKNESSQVYLSPSNMSDQYQIDQTYLMASNYPTDSSENPDFVSLQENLQSSSSGYDSSNDENEQATLTPSVSLPTIQSTTDFNFNQESLLNDCQSAVTTPCIIKVSKKNEVSQNVNLNMSSKIDLSCGRDNKTVEKGKRENILNRKDFWCEVCKKSFLSAHTLLSHYKNKHKIDDSDLSFGSLLNHLQQKESSYLKTACLPTHDSESSESFCDYSKNPSSILYSLLSYENKTHESSLQYLEAPILSSHIEKLNKHVSAISTSWSHESVNDVPSVPSFNKIISDHPVYHQVAASTVNKETSQHIEKLVKQVSSMCQSSSRSHETENDVPSVLSFNMITSDQLVHCQVAASTVNNKSSPHIEKIAKEVSAISQSTSRSHETDNDVPSVPSLTSEQLICYQDPELDLSCDSKDKGIFIKGKNVVINKDTDNWCKICNTCFYSPYNLRRHCRNVHNMTIPKGTSGNPFGPFPCDLDESVVPQSTLQYNEIENHVPSVQSPNLEASDQFQQAVDHLTTDSTEIFSQQDENSETVKIGSKEYQRGQGSFHVNDKQGGENSEIIKIGSNEYIRGNSISILKKDFHALDNQCEVQFNRERMFIESKMSKESPKTPELPSPTTANQPLESGSFLPVIVDVMSAKDGGQAIYACDETAKSSKMSNPSAIDDSEVVDDPSKKVKNQTLNIIQNVKVSKNAPSVLQSFPKVMHKHSIFTLQKSIPVIPEGQEIFPDTRNLFSLKTHTTRNKLAVQSLRTRLKAEDYITNSVWWLIQNHYLPMNPPCTLCGSRDFLIERDDKFHDKYCWICRNGNCLAREPIKRPKFFERFQLFTLEDLLLLTFHWACQSDIEEILADVSLDVETIWNYYKALQELCHNAVIKSGKIGTCPKARIETSVVKLGNYFILGALERFNRFTRLQVIPVNEAFETDRHLKLLEEWLNYNSVLISESKIPDEFLRNVYKVSSDPTFTDSKSNGYHIMNISRYLVRNMIGIFGKVKVQFLHQQIVQGFLNELMWRDRNGKFFDQAFWNILIDIGKLDRETMVQPNPVIVNRGRTLDNDCSHLSPALVARWGRVKTTAVKENEDIPFIDTIPKSLVTEIEIEEKVPEKTYEKSFTQTSNAVKISRILRDNGFLNILFQDLPEVPGGELLVTPKVLLGIKIVLNDSLDFLEKYKAESISLGLRLSAEGFINSPVRWLVKKGFIRSKAPCYVCHNTSFLRDNPKYEDGCSWLCQWPSCKFENIFKRPHFYARFPMLPIAHMNAMVYHWTVHSEISRITSDAPMEISKLQHVWRSFQVLCSTSLRRKKVRLGGEGEMVEVAMVQFGKLYILGAMERRTKYTLLRTFYVDLGGQIPVFLKILTQWILPLSFVIINATKYVQMPPEYNIMVANTSITDPNDIGFHVLNITTYLLQHVSSMFGHLKAEDVRAEVMQIYLDELMWRERYGRMPSETFYNILGDIFDLETKDKPVDLNINNHSSLQKENVCMFDKLAVRSEKNGPSHESKTCVNDKTTEIQIDLTKLPECRVVLKRLSEEVLKYYDCWGYLRNRSSLAAKEFGRTSSYEKFRHDPSRKVFYKFCESKVSCKNPKTYGKWQNIFDESQPMSEQSHSRLQSFSKSESSRKRRRQSSNEDSDVDGDLRDDASSHSNDSLFSMSSNSSVCEVSEIPYTTRSQKLAQPDVVVKTEKIEPEETRIESLAQKTVKQRTVSQRSMPPRNLKQRTVIPRTITPNLVQKTEIVPKEDTEKELICVECGKNICMDHFMKQFLCMDCKRSVYTTSCCNSFMEHRGYLLFGKRMPRRNQTDKEQYGLHKVITLQDSYYCACGFHSNIGNKLATHMVHCGKSTCFYHAEIS